MLWCWGAISGLVASISMVFSSGGNLFGFRNGMLHSVIATLTERSVPFKWYSGIYEHFVGAHRFAQPVHTGA